MADDVIGTDMDEAWAKAKNLPYVGLGGVSESRWERIVRLREELEEKFGDQQIDDFTYATECNGWPYKDMDGYAIVDLKCLEVGYNDEGDWLWAVCFKRAGKIEWWMASGGCDYTGWDCRSDLRWTMIEGTW